MLRDAGYRLRYALSIIDIGALALRSFKCPLCGPSVLVRLARAPIGVRCARCGASAITLSMVAVLLAERSEFRRERVYELSARGPLFEFLWREVKALAWSEYFDDVEPGAWRNGVQCQDVQRLTHADASFDLVTSTEVFEHVPEDRKGFAEIRRVLRPGGAFIFTVPLSGADRTVERAQLEDGSIRHMLPAEYHDDRIRGRGSVLVYRDYGLDIIQRLREAGFAAARVEQGFERAFLGEGSRVIVALA